MKKIPLLIAFTVFVLTGCKSNAQQLGVYYMNNQGQKVFLDAESTYDTEEKPVNYFVTSDGAADDAIYIVEVYRILSSPNKPEHHFYKSFSISSSEISNGFDISGVFSEITSPFIISDGFVLSVCKSKRSDYLKLDSKDQCESQVQFKVLKGM